MHMADHPPEQRQWWHSQCLTLCEPHAPLLPEWQGLLPLSEHPFYWDPALTSVHSIQDSGSRQERFPPTWHHSSESSKLLECQWWSFVTLWPFSAKYHPRLIDWKVILLMPSQTKHSGLFAHFLIHSLLLGGSISFQVPELLTPYHFHWLMLFSHLAFSLFSNYVNSFFHPLPSWPCIGWLLSGLIGYAMVSEASWSDTSIAKVFDYIRMNGVPHGHPDAYLSITNTEIKQMRDRH